MYLLNKESETSTIWDEITVNRVKSHWMEVKIDDSYLVESTEDAVLHIIFKEFQQQILRNVPLAVIEKEDCVLIRDGVRFVQGTVVRVVWNPTTNVVDFIDGPLNGRQMAINHIPDPYYVPVNNQFEFVKGYYGPPDFDKVVYNYAGWNPVTRHWVYRAQK